MKVEFEFTEQISDKINKYRVLVNKKLQGFVLFYNYSATNQFYRIDGDDSKTNYSGKDEVVEAVCARNGRKLKKKE